ncbi:hypothetical protein ILUMI_03089 [Ignelater luminosus]|uniref:Uncharacterized protein n=1 Tax=Ignelater luminosus TaxID=2038154 RepID=A0A8K0DFB0_IGNLU|nr:hypothetical protein ILUMI_03089 [Ignelater luminosus]
MWKVFIERGFSDEVTNKEGDVVLGKSLNNKVTCWASNYLGKGEDDKTNQVIGGVDFLDQLLSYYRIFIRSKKWTLRVITHMIEQAAGWSIKKIVKTVVCVQSK